LDSQILYDFGKGSIFADHSCIKGCSKCCGYAYYLPKELETLPGKITEQLTNKGGVHEISREKGRCIFYDGSGKEGEFYCTVHPKRPIRCRIYPYLPVIVNKRIVITLEPAVRMLNTVEGDHHDCPGIGLAGSKTLSKVIEECMVFLKLLSDVPEVLKTFILDQDSFNRIRDDKWCMRKAR
ncbi:MAG: YkgJ family cysteine cluster protein, partial [Candidatus Hodarchaeales archaeon]